MFVFTFGTRMLFILLAAVLWGVTNPLLKRYSAGFHTAEREKRSAWDDVVFLVKRPRYLVTQIANLLGSVAFFAALRDVSVSTGSIVTNSLAFVITVIMSVWVLKEGTVQPRTYCGMVFVLLGTSICTLAK